MKKLPRVASIVLIGAIAFTAIGTAFGAWTVANPTPAICATIDQKIFAQDGDAVTVSKWNNAMCIMTQLFIYITDWPVMRNPAFAWHSNPSNAGRALLTEINLPAIASISGNSAGYAGAIHWKDPTVSYGNGAGYKGGIMYNETKKELEFL
jgi:hypothetical protein